MTRVGTTKPKSPLLSCEEDANATRYCTLKWLTKRWNIVPSSHCVCLPPVSRRVTSGETSFTQWRCSSGFNLTYCWETRKEWHAFGQTKTKQMSFAQRKSCILLWTRFGVVTSPSTCQRQNEFWKHSRLQGHITYTNTKLVDLVQMHVSWDLTTHNHVQHPIHPLIESLLPTTAFPANSLIFQNMSTKCQRAGGKLWQTLLTPQ